MLWSCDIRSADLCVVTYVFMKDETFCTLPYFPGLFYGYPEFEENGGWVNIAKQILIAKLCSHLLEMGFQIMQPCHLAKCKS